MFVQADELNWVSPNDYIGHGFTLKFSDCKLNVAGIRLKNSCCTRGTRAFHIFGILEDCGPWVQILEGELDSPRSSGFPAPPLKTFYFEEAVQVQFLRLDLNSHWGLSGGLNFLEVIPVSGSQFSSFCYYPFPNRAM